MQRSPTWKVNLAKQKENERQIYIQWDRETLREIKKAEARGIHKFYKGSFEPDDM